jgi:exodeoxyribonuclease VII large subunit
VVNDLALRHERLRARELQLAALSPLAILERGYSVTWLEGAREVVRSIGQVERGSRTRTRVTDGVIVGVVDSIERTSA